MNNKKYGICIIGLFAMAAAVSFYCFYRHSVSERYKTGFTSENTVSINAGDIASVMINEHYGDGETDMRSVTVYMNDEETFLITVTDYAAIKNETVGISKDDYEKIMEKASGLSIVRTYDTPPSVIWNYVQIVTKDNEFYFFNDQTEVNNLMRFLFKKVKGLSDI